jgi:hypothetical protein
MTRRRSNYALVEFSEQLGVEDELDVPWAAFVGNRSSEHAFEVPADDPVDGCATVQAYDVGSYGHDILINGETLTGFDIPPSDGWQCWMDVMAGVELVAGTNTIAVERNEESDDSFAVGTVRVTWREPVGEPGRDADGTPVRSGGDADPDGSDATNGRTPEPESETGAGPSDGRSTDT